VQKITSPRLVGRGPKIPWLYIILGGLLSVVVTAYSAYAGLKIGGVYWPILATSVFSMAILRIFGVKNTNIVNIVQTGANTGGMLAAGIIFTVPAAWILGFQFTIIQITLIALIGSLLGLLFSIPLRTKLLHLPYPDGTAAATVIKSQDQSGQKTKKLAIASILGGILAAARDGFGIIPGSISFINLSFIGLSGGFLIGTLFTAIWFLGSVVSYFILGNFISRPDLTNTGIGMIIGTSLAYLLTTIFPLLKTLLKDWRNLPVLQRNYFISLLILAVVVLTIFTKANFAITVFSTIGAFLMGSVAAFVTGQLNIDPMEIFAIITLLVVKFLFPADFSSLIVLAALITIAAGVAGDIMQDYKTGKLLNTPPHLQTIAQIVGNITASLTIGFIIIAIAHTSGFGNNAFPAPQATAIAGTIKSQSIQTPMIIGVVTGAILSFALSFKNLGLSPIAFGIGMYVPQSLSISLFLGGLVRAWSDSKKRTDDDRLTAAGLIAGESLVGVILTITQFIKTIL